MAAEANKRAVIKSISVGWLARSRAAAPGPIRPRAMAVSVAIRALSTPMTTKGRKRGRSRIWLVDAHVRARSGLESARPARPSISVASPLLPWPRPSRSRRPDQGAPTCAGRDSRRSPRSTTAHFELRPRWLFRSVHVHRGTRPPHRPKERAVRPDHPAGERDTAVRPARTPGTLPAIHPLGETPPVHQLRGRPGAPLQ